jgi:ABC-type sulfate transport system permease component
VSLYRQAGRTSWRVAVAAAVIALLVGGAAGYAIGRSSAPEPSLADQVADLKGRLAPAREAIELTTTEYPQAVRAGEIVAPTEYQAAKADVARARDSIAAALADLRAVDAARARRLQETVAALGAAVDRRVATSQVDELARAVSNELESGN